MIPGITAHILPPAGGGPITYVGGADAYTTSATNLTVTLPTHQANDFAIAFMSGDIGEAVTWTETASSGWTQFYHTDNGSENQACFYKKLTSGSETNPNFSQSVSGETWGVTVVIFRGVDTTTPFDGSAAYNTDPFGNYDGPFPTLTTSNSTSAFVGFCWVKGSKPTSLTNSSTSPGTLTAVMQGFIDAYNRGVFYDLEIGSSGSITYNQDNAWDPTSGPGQEAIYGCLALKRA